MFSWAKLRPVRDVGVVVLALFVPFFVLRSHLRDPKAANELDRAVVSISAPVQWTAAMLGRGISNLWGDYAYLVDVKADNARLAFENARLEDHVRRLEQADVENRRLRRLLGLRESLPGDVVSAQVIGKDVNDFFRVWRLTLDRGNRDVRAAMPVIALGGVVGTVLRVSGDTVDVKLLVDADSAVDVVVERTGARSIVRGTGDPSKYVLKAQYAERADEIDVGDLMVTSGVGRRFPKGIPVARVTRVVKREFGIYQEVEASPTVDFSRIEEALILTSPPSDDPGGDRGGPSPVAAQKAPRLSELRNTAFVAVGVFFLILQANVYRALALWNVFVGSVTDHMMSWGFSSAVPLVSYVGALIATPNLLLPLIIFAGVHEYSLPRGAALAFVLGYALDIFAAAPVGLFTCVSVATFLLARAAGVRLAAQTVLTQLALAFVFALAYSLLVLVLLAILANNPYGPRALAIIVLPHAVSTALAAPFVFSIAQRIHQVTITVPRPGEGPPR